MADPQAYNIKLATVKRWLRTILPQVPALVGYAMNLSGITNLPSWVVPALILAGSLATALDKFLRDIGFYDDVRNALIQ